MKKTLIILLVLFVSVGSMAQFKNHSVLSSGTITSWCVESEGLYKISASDLSSKAAYTPVAIQSFALFGNNSGMLPQSNRDLIIDDLAPVAVSFQGDEDSLFNHEDYFLFYSPGPHKKNLIDQTPSHNLNLYSNEICYFLKQETGISNLWIDTLSPQAILDTPNTAVAYKTFYHEKEEYKVIGSGRDWYGDKISGGQTKMIQVPVQNKKDSAVTVHVKLVSMGQNVETSFSVKINGAHEEVLISPLLDKIEYGTHGRLVSKIYTVYTQDNFLDVAVTFNNGGSTNAIGYIESVDVQYVSDLTQQNSEGAFFLTTGVYKAQKDAVLIKDELVPIVLKKGETYLLDQKSTVFLVNETFPKPVFKKIVSNQDLHSFNGSPKMMIITHDDFLSEAQRLADFRNAHGTPTEVYEISKIYNEFSTGVLDVSAIRNFIRMHYLGHESDLRYVLFFGDGTYDYKNFSGTFTSFIPSYQSRESLNNIQTYASDDFYVMLEAHEGVWEETSNNKDNIDLSVGRLPVMTVQDAATIVDKLIAYESSKATLGEWRNNITFVADDGNWNMHMRHGNNFAKILEDGSTPFDITKLFMDSYIQYDGGTRVPDMENDLEKSVMDGSLIVNFNGHGGEQGWTEEGILSIPSIDKWKNKDKLVFFFTATCEFGRYDEPLVNSASEILLSKADGGAIGLISTTRPVYANSNEVLGLNFYKNLLVKDSLGAFKSIGTLFRETKNQSIIGVNNRNFSLLGDPSMVLALPNNEVKVISFQGDSIYETFLDTVGAYSRFTFTGNILDHKGDLMRNFNGKLMVTVYDKEEELVTLGSEVFNNIPLVFKYNVQDKDLTKAVVDVVKGRFQCTLILPRDINFQYGRGRMSFYAQQDDGTDAIGVFNQFSIGGSSRDFVYEENGPLLEMFINDTLFELGDSFDEDSLLTFIAYVSDETGFNLSSKSIGQGFSYQLDSKKYINANAYFELFGDESKEGIIMFKLPILEKGDHSLVMKSFDIFGNSSSDTIRFYVGDSILLGIEESLEEELREEFMLEKVTLHTLSGQVLGEISLDDVIVANNQEFKIFTKEYATGVYFLLIKGRYRSKNSSEIKVQRVVIMN